MGISITRLIWIVGIHSIIHAIFGIFFISTSYYVNYSEGLIYSYIALHILLLVIGFSIFCIVVWRRPLCARIFAVILMLFTIIYLIVGTIYFLTYVPFYANSIFDTFFFYTEVECWTGPDYAMTFWHIFAFILPLIISLWFFYAYLLCKLADCACCIPCPPPPCLKNQCNNDMSYGGSSPQCCQKSKWYHKLIKPGPCSPPICQTNWCPPCPPPPPCPPCSAPCPPTSQQYTTSPCTPCGKKSPKFVLTLRPGRVCNK